VSSSRWLRGPVLLACLTLAAGCSDSREERIERRIAALEQSDRAQPPPRGAVFFVGSSAIARWSTLAQDMAPLTVVNRGVAEARFPDIMAAVRRTVLPHGPRAVVVYAGDNDLASGSSRDAADVEGKYRELARVVQHDAPATDIFVLSIKASFARQALWPEMRAANLRLEAWTASDPRLHYLDVATPLLAADGTPRPECLASDGLHPSAQGYAEWTRVIRGPLLQLAGER
jgi:lysophospholipase L1-like esterase